MNVCLYSGRLTRDPLISYLQKDNTPLARYTLAVERDWSGNGEEPGADFISCTVFGKGAEFAEKYLRQGTKLIVRGRTQTGSYTNKEGKKVYTTDCIVEKQEFAESKKTSETNAGEVQQAPEDSFMNIPSGIEEELPFK